MPRLSKRKKKGRPSKMVKKRPKVIEKKPAVTEWIKTGVPGFDGLFRKGIPKGANILIAGGPGTGKTIFCLQTLYNAVRMGHNCLYITLEELPMRLRHHMREFGWDVEELEKSGFKLIQRDPFKIARSVEALLESLKGRLPIGLAEVTEIVPKGSKPYMIVLDSISALESAFTGRPESYRIYIEQLFRLFERIGATTFLITETEEAPKTFSRSGVEEFLADGVFVLYYFKVGDLRVRAIEVLKMRGVKHVNKIVPFQITDRGMEVFPGERLYEIREAE
jgi:KaiC/GvpD/RAD55 family RecA-like ATPase